MHLDSTFRSRSLLLALALLLTCGVTPGVEIKAGPAAAITFIEVRVEARGHAGSVLRQQANASHEYPASAGQVISLQEISRSERFVVLEREPPDVLTTRGRGTRALIESLTDDLIAPPDQRSNREFDEITTAPGQRVDARANFYVVTHVDIAPPDQSQIETALRKLAAAARQSDGNLGFEILQQIDRPNHFNLISAWIGESPFRTFSSSTAARQFRQTVGPFLGSPYDERLFRRVD
jgi:quinol monooxygenase YgiN